MMGGNHLKPAQNNQPSRRLIILTLAPAAALALAGLNDSLRADDVWSLRTASLPLGEMLAAIAADVHPPLYFLLMWPWVRLFGGSEPALRSLPLLLHWLAIAAVYMAAAKALPRRAAWLAAVAYACAPLALLSAELVRMYSLLGLLAALSIWAWQDVASKPGVRPAVVWVLINVAGTFTHLWWFCWMAGQALAAFVCHRDQARRWAACFAAAVAPYAVLWGPALWRQVGRSSDAAAWLEPPNAGIIVPVVFLLLGALVAALPVALLSRWRGPWDRTWAMPPWLPLMVAGTLLPPLIVSFWKPFFYVRFTIVALPALCCWVAGWCARGRAAVTAWIVIACMLIFTLGMLAMPEGCDARLAARFLAEHAADGDTVLYVSLSRPATSYYLDRLRPGRQWRESSFPAAIDTHPGYEGDARNPASIPVWREEAAAVARAAAERPGARLWVLLRDGHAPSRVLAETLEREMVALPGPALECGGRENYFNLIRVYAARPAAALH